MLLIPALNLWLLINSVTASSSSSEESTSATKSLPSVFATLTNNGISYAVKAEFGSDNQSINLRVDIAQPYVWVVSSSLEASCNDPGNSTCVGNGSYNITSTNSSYDLGYEQDFTFLNGIEINGSLVQDNVKILNYNGSDDINVSLLDFINVNESSIGVGAFGLAGSISGETLSSLTNGTFLQTLVNQGEIPSNSYSFFAQNNKHLELTFGGLNPNHFIDDLVLFKNVPFIDSDSQQLYYNFPIIPLTQINVVASSGSSVILSSDDYPVLFDSRFTYSLLPFETIISLAIQLNAYYSSVDNLWLLKCSTGDLGATLAFQFANLTIQVPVSNFLKNLLEDDGTQIVFEDGDSACILTVLPDNTYGYSILGTNFLRSVFLAVDNDNQQLALAQAYNDFYLNQTEFSNSNYTTRTSTTIEYTESLIQSSTIPYAVPNNITDYTIFTFSVNSDQSASTIPEDITASVTDGTIYTGRGASTTDSNTASDSAKYSANGNTLRNEIGNTLFGVFVTLLSFLI